MSKTVIPYRSGFLNVDLEIESPSSLAALALAANAATEVFVLYDGEGGHISPTHHLLSLEVNEIEGCFFTEQHTADEVIHALCAFVEKQGQNSAARQAWDGAVRKAFDAGCEVLEGERAIRFSLRPDTLQRLVTLGGSLEVTCYHFNNEEELES